MRPAAFLRRLTSVLAVCVLPGLVLGNPEGSAPPEMTPFSAQVLVKPRQSFTIPPTIPDSFGRPVSVAEVVVVDDRGKEERIPSTGALIRGRTPSAGGAVKMLSAGGAVLGVITLLSGAGGGSGETAAIPSNPAELAPRVQMRPGPVLSVHEATRPTDPPAVTPPVAAGAAPGLMLPTGPNPVVAFGTFEPEKIASYEVTTEFTEPATEESTSIVAETVPVFATEEAMVSIVDGAEDQVGPARLTIADPETGKTQTGEYRAWSARVVLLEASTTPGKPVPGRVEVYGLEPEARVRFVVRAPEGTIQAPGARLSQWSGMLTVRELTETAFTVTFHESGVRNVFLQIAPAENSKDRIETSTSGE